MALMSGNVRVTVQMDGKGDAPRKVKETSDALDKTKQSSDAARDAAKGLADRVDSIKGSAGGVNKVREAFENLKGNAGFIIGGIATAATLASVAIDALAGDLFKGSAAMREWETTRGSMADGMKKTTAIAAELRAELDKLQGKNAPTTLDIKTEEANDRLLEINRQIAVGEVATKQWSRSLEMMRLSPAFVFAAESFAEEQKKNNADLVDLKKQQLNLNNLNLDAERERSIESLRQVSALQAYLRGDKSTAKDEVDATLKVDPTKVPGYAAPGTNKPRVGGGGSKRDGWNDLIAQQKKYAGFAKDRIAINPDQALIDLVGEEGAKAIREAEKRIEASAPNDGENGASSGAAAKIASDFDLATAAVKRFSDQMAPVLDEVFPGMGSAVSGIDTIMQAYAATTEKTGKAMVQAALTGSTAVIGGVGRMLGGKKGEWIAMSIAEGAAAAASFAIGDFWGGGQHLVSAAGYAAAAASAGGGGGRSTSRGGGGGGSRQTSRSTTDRSASQAMPAVVINGNWMGAASPQETAAEMRALQARGERSGYVPRGG